MFVVGHQEGSVKATRAGEDRRQIIFDDVLLRRGEDVLEKGEREDEEGGMLIIGQETVVNRLKEVEGIGFRRSSDGASGTWINVHFIGEGQHVFLTPGEGGEGDERLRRGGGGEEEKV